MKTIDITNITWIDVLEILNKQKNYQDELYAIIGTEIMHIMPDGQNLYYETILTNINILQPPKNQDEEILKKLLNLIK